MFWILLHVKDPENDAGALKCRIRQMDEDCIRGYENKAVIVRIKPSYNRLFSTTFLVVPTAVT
jgi:hypothetical protein